MIRKGARSMCAAFLRAPKWKIRIRRAGLSSFLNGTRERLFNPGLRSDRKPGSSFSMHRIAIFGPGLLGGSLALKLRTAGNCEVRLWARRVEALAEIKA